MNPFITVLIWTVILLLAFTLNMGLHPRTATRLTWVALAIATVGGLLCYTYGYSYLYDNPLLSVIRATVSTAGILLGDEDISAVSDAPFFQNPWGLTLFWALHLIAFYATASAIFGTVGAGLVRRGRLLLARRGQLVLIYGSHEGALAFGRQMMSRRGIAVVFVDSGTNKGSADAIHAMGSLLRCDNSALSPDRRFLRSLGVRGKRELWLYALQSDESDNQRYAAQLLQALQQVDFPSQQTHLTLLARDEGVENAFLAGAEYGYGSVTVMDEAEIAARLLVRQAPPCQALSFDAQGLAQQDFHCLIVGFGRVGQAALRHVAINAQFAGSTFHAAVFAPDCDRVSGYLSCQSRELLAQYDITLHSCDARSRQMYDYLSQHGSAVNYIAVCTGSRRLNQEIAAELMNFLSRQGRALPICLCSHSGVQLLVQGRRSSQRSLYDADVLHQDVLDRKARILNQAYSRDNGLSETENWRRCDYFSRMSSRAAADFAPAFLRMAGMTAEEVACRGWSPSGALLENLACTEHMRWCAFHCAMGFSPMPSQVHLERARRYAAGEALRITKDLAARQHACLIPWSQLDALSQAENAITGGSVDYKDLDRRNVLSLAQLLQVK